MSYPAQDLTANGVTVLELPPGEWTIQAKGSFGGGTLSIGWDAVDGSPVEYPSGSLTSSGGGIYALAAGCRFVLTLSGATSPSIKVRVGEAG